MDYLKGLQALSVHLGHSGDHLLEADQLLPGPDVPIKRHILYEAYIYGPVSRQFHKVTHFVVVHTPHQDHIHLQSVLSSSKSVDTHTSYLKVNNEKLTATEVHAETSTFCNIVSLLLSFRFRALMCTKSYASKGLIPVTELSQQAEEKKRHLDRPESQLNGVVNGGKHPLQAPPPCQLLKAIFSQRVQAEIQERQACTKVRV